MGYQYPRHFDSHAYRTEDYEGVKDFARGSMQTYLVLKEKARQWNEDAEIKAILAEIEETNKLYQLNGFDTLKAENFNRQELAAKGLKYERLDQLTIDILLGVR